MRLSSFTLSQYLNQDNEDLLIRNIEKSGTGSTHEPQNLEEPENIHPKNFSESNPEHKGEIPAPKIQNHNQDHTS